MRIKVKGGSGNQPVRLLTKRQDGKCYGVVIQVIDNVTMNFSNSMSDLQQKDPLGNPIQGWTLTGAQNVPFFISEYNDDLFVAATADGNLEVQQYAIS